MSEIRAESIDILVQSVLVNKVVNAFFQTINWFLRDYSNCEKDTQQKCADV